VFYLDTLGFGGKLASIRGKVLEVWGCVEPLVRAVGGKAPRSWKLFAA